MDIPNEIKEAEKLLGQRCHNYVIIAAHDNAVSYFVSSKPAAYGLMAMLMQEIEFDWHNDMHPNEDKEDYES